MPNESVSETAGKNKRIIALVMGALLIAFSLQQLHSFSRNNRDGEAKSFENALVEIPYEEFPENTLYITSERKAYTRGDLSLIIPAVNVNTSVGDSTEEEALRKMPGLYAFSQLPGYSNGNVSIAGHRDIHDMVFYSLDKVKPGDYLYLVYNSLVYRYEYVESKIIKPTNWDVIKPQGFSCLTLTTCDPIGSTVNRLVVTAKLVDTTPYSQDYVFVVSVGSNTGSSGAE